MGLLNVFKKSADSSSGSDAAFTRTYTNLPRFKGTRRLHITIYGDKDATKNSRKLLNGEQLFDAVGHEITLTGFRFDGGTGIRVAVDGDHVGIVWNHGDDEIYLPTWNGDIEGVFVRIESGPNDRPDAKLFVKLAE